MDAHFLIKKDKSTWYKSIDGIVEASLLGRSVTIDGTLLNSEELTDFQNAVHRREKEAGSSHVESYKESLLTIIKDDQEAYLEKPNSEESIRMIPYLEKLIITIESSF